jgi:hypothetical protein
VTDRPDFPAALSENQLDRLYGRPQAGIAATVDVFASADTPAELLDNPTGDV